MRAAEAGFLAGLFALAGVAVGVVGWVTTGWAETAFATAAGGDAERFGPVFVAQAYLVVTAAALLLAPVLACVLGVLVGSRSFDATAAIGTCGVGTGLGALAYGLIVTGLVVVSQGAAATQAYAFTDALWPLFVTTLASGAVGAVAGALGSQAG